MPRLTGGEAIVACLQAQDVDTLFGIPGVHNLAIYDALRRTPTIRTITTRHEGGAGFMADGYARVTGRPGVCVTITGPGAANALAPLVNAYADSSPVLLICSEVDSRVYGRGLGAFHEIPSQLDMLRGAVGWAESIQQVEDIPGVFEAAWQTMLAGRPRAAAIQIPTNILQSAAEVRLPSRYTPTRPRPDPVVIAQAAALLAQAERPIIYAGQGVLASDASHILAHVAEMIGAPVMTTCSGRGALPEDHPLSLGYGWTWPSGPFGPLLAEADAVLVVGSSLDIYDTSDASLPLPSKIIQIDIDQREIGKTYQVSLPVVADARLALAALAEALALVPPSIPASTGRREGHQRRAEISQRVAALRAEGQAHIQTQPGWQMMQAIHAALPRDAIVTGDAAGINAWQIYHLPTYTPRSTPFPMHNAALGFGYPAALGAQAAYPGRAVIAVCGDGGTLFTAQELATAMHYGLNVVLIVFNDNGYRSIEAYQRRMYGEPYAGELTNPDFAQLGAAFGALGLRAETPDALETAVRTALAAARPAVIEVPGFIARPTW